jgi:serine/threonine protein kinase
MKISIRSGRSNSNKSNSNNSNSNNSNSNQDDLIEAKNSSKNKIQIQLNEIIGQGGEGVVYKAYSNNTRIVAKKQDFNNRDLEFSSIINSLAASLVLSSEKSACDKHIMCLIGIVISSDRLPRFRAYINDLEKNPSLETLIYTSDSMPYEDFYWLYEYIEGEQLDRVIHTNTYVAEDLCNQLLEAVNFIHSNQIVHLDIKPDNIMITKTNELKLVDLGFLCKVAGRSCKIRGSTADYSAPNLNIKPESNTQRINQLYKADIFALGLTLYEIMTGTIGMNAEKSLSFQESGHLELDFPKDVDKWKPMIQAMVSYNPDERPTAQEALHMFKQAGGNKHSDHKRSKSKSKSKSKRSNRKLNTGRKNRTLRVEDVRL